MNLLPITSPTISAPVLRARLASRGLAHANHSSSLNSEGGDEDRRRATAERRRDPARLSHSDTVCGVSLWDGPRLSPTFVAQVIGQIVMEGNERASAVPTAYRAAQIAPGAFFDRGA